MSLPRSAVLAAWTGAVLAGRADVADAVRAIVGDEDHDVARQAVDEARLSSTGLLLPDPAYMSDLLVLLAVVAENNSLAVRVVLPVPGDALGIPPATGLLGWACDAGECVVFEAGGGAQQPWGLALVPDVAGFGSDLEAGVHVTWHTWTVDASPAAPSGHMSVAEADMALRTVLHDVTKALERLDVAAWRPPGSSAYEAISAAGRLPPLPPTLSPRSLGLLTSASAVLAIVDAATSDMGGAVTGHEITRRSDALSGAARAARRAVEAAVNLPG